MVLLTIFSVSLILRVLLSFLPSFEVDFGGWIAWAERLANLGPANFYSKEVWTNYLPGYLYVLWFFGEIRNLIQIPADSVIYEVILKLPANLADLGIGFLIFKILVKKVDKKIALPATIFYLFNPALIFNSSIWGHMDSVFTFFLILGAYFLTEGKKVFASWAMIAIALLIKPQAIAAMPVFAFGHLLEFGLKKTLVGAIFGLILIFGASLPFFIKNPFWGFPQLFFQMAADYPYTSLFAFNFWWIIGGWRNDLTTGFLFSNQIWGTLLWIVSQVSILFWLKKNYSKENFYTACAISLLAFFVLPTRVHERYLFPFFAFATIVATNFGRIFWVILGVLTFVHFLNLYFVYTYYTPNFLKIESLIQLINDFSIALAAITVFIFSLMIGFLFNKRWHLKT